MDTSESEATATQQERSVEVRFVTRLGAEWKVTETPFSVPARLTRHGLSEVVNHLLGRGTGTDASSEPPAVPFDFLVAGDFVRTSLGKHLRDRSIAAGEGVVTVEYTFADPPPGNLPPREHGDWVGAVCGLDDATFVSGGYDGRLRLWGDAGLLCDVANAATAAIKATVVVPTATTMIILTAGKDHVVRAWSISKQQQLQVAPVATLTGHSDSVDALDASPDGSRACSASWDRTLRLWELASTGNKGEEEEEEVPAKRAKTGGAKAVAVLRGHSDAVTAVQWPTHVQLLSGGYDNTVRLWDAARAENVATLRGQKAVSCIAYSTATGLCVSGHHDGFVRFWDPRAAPTDASATASTSTMAVSTRALKAHKGWITALAWHPSRQTLFLSASTDGALKVWDIRSAVPMHASRNAHGSNGKILCACWWQRGTGIALEALSGGTDGTIQRRSMP